MASPSNIRNTVISTGQFPMPTESLADSAAMNPAGAKDDPECVGGKDSPYTQRTKPTKGPKAPFGPKGAAV